MNKKKKRKKEEKLVELEEERIEEAEIVEVKSPLAERFKVVLAPIISILQKLTTRGLIVTLIILILITGFVVYIYRFYLPAEQLKYIVNLVKKNTPYSKVKQKLSEISEKYPNKTKLYTTLANEYLNLGKADITQELIFHALSIKPLDRQANKLFVKLLLKNKRYNQAEDILKSITARYSWDKDLWLLYAHLLYNTQRLKGAIKCLQRVLGLNKRNVQAYELLQKIYYYKFNDKEMALSIHRKVYYTLKHLINPKILNKISEFLIKEGKYKEASKLSQQILNYKEDKDALYNLCYCLYKQGNLDTALHEILNFEDYYKDYRFYNLLGKIFYKKNRFLKAKEYLLSSLKLNNKNINTLERLGDVYYSLNNYIQANNYYTKSKILGNNTYRLNYKLGLVNYKLNRFNTSEKIFTSILDYEPEYTRYNLACALLMQKKLSQAKMHINSMIEEYKTKLFERKILPPSKKRQLYHKLSKLYNNLGVIEELNGNETQAISLYLQAIEIGSLAKKENKTAVKNMQRIFRRIPLTSLRKEYLCDIWKLD